MPSQLLLALAGAFLALPLGCSEGTQGTPTGSDGGDAGDDRPFVPEELPHREVSGEGGLTLVAFTLEQGGNGAALYAAVRNDGEAPACEAGMTTDFFDRAGDLVTSTASTLQSGKLYRFDDGSDVIINCVPPGEIAMTAATNIDVSVVVEELGHLEYQFPAFVVGGIVPSEGLTVSGLRRLATSGVSTYAGTVTNALDVAVTNPKVSVFPVNRVGRPLGVATKSDMLELQPSGSWSFETNGVSEHGTGEAAYASASIPQ